MKEQLAIERHLETVTLTIICSSQCAAMKLYDQLCADASEGRVELGVVTVITAPSVPSPASSREQLKP